MNTLYGPILIVEDVPNVLELLEVTLRFKGYAVLTARNGEEALESDFASKTRVDHHRYSDAETGWLCICAETAAQP